MKLQKDPVLKGKLPTLPGKNIFAGFGLGVVGSRMKKLTSKYEQILTNIEYMNELAANVNIFEVEAITSFLRTDYNAPHIAELRQKYNERQAEAAEKVSYSSPSE